MLHSNQSSTVWQVEIAKSRNPSTVAPCPRPSVVHGHFHSRAQFPNEVAGSRRRRSGRLQTRFSKLQFHVESALDRIRAVGRNLFEA